MSIYWKWNSARNAWNYNIYIHLYIITEISHEYQIKPPHLIMTKLFEDVEIHKKHQ